MSRVTVPREKGFYAFDPRLEPAVLCSPGDVVVFETREAPDGQIQRDDDFRRPLDPGRANPTTGPVAVEGSRRGDCLAVTIRRIGLRGPGYIGASPGTGTIPEALSERSGRVLPLEDGRVRLGGLALEARPMVGVIGTTPPRRVKTNMCGEFGGNMDNRKIRPGATVYLPVLVEGANLGIGDLHVSMGDGELCGAGIEVSGEVEVEVRLRRNLHLAFPVVETGEEWLIAGEGGSLIAAVQTGCRRAHSLLTRYAGMNAEDAYLFLSAFGDVEVNQCSFCEGISDPEGRPVPGGVRLPASIRVALPKMTGVEALPQAEDGV